MRDRSLCPAALTAFLAVSAFVMPSVAAAQGLIFDWDGEKTTADSGKTHVKFNGGGKPGEIVVSFADRKLYFFTGPGEADVYPVATPRDQSRWEGVTSVSQKRENPSWTPTAHMLSENPKLPRWVPGGHPMNPLGIRALYLGASDYRIHGTDAPWTIGTPVSKGCVRMFNKDVVDLYPRVKVGTKVTVTWQKFDGKTFAINETKGITELPATAPLTADGKAAKTAQASASASEATAAPKSKWRKPATDASEDATLPMAEDKPKVAAEKAPTDDEGVVKKRKWSKAKPADGDEASNDVKTVSKSEAKAEAKPENKGETAKNEDKTEPVKAVADANVTTEPKREKRVRTASHTKSQVKTDASVETGSVSKKADDAAALGVAEKALAAAERAAAAAERAAAAAERAAAASQVKPAVEATAATPAVEAPAQSTAN